MTGESTHGLPAFPCTMGYSDEFQKLLRRSNAVEVVVKHGLASREQVGSWRRMLDEWRDSPGALAAIAWGEAIARKPSALQ